MKNNIYKKITAIAVSVVLCLCAASCSFPGNSGTTTASNTVRITFPEGCTVCKAAALLEKNGVCSASDFLTACSSAPKDFEYSSWLKTDGSCVFALEGYIAPDTYDFYKGESASNALSRFLKNFENEIPSDIETKAAAFGMTPAQIITLASVIQAEAGTYSEMVKVSSVFHNRLSNTSVTGGKLQSAATKLYVTVKLKDYLKPEDTAKYLALYSTYSIAGLPSGPICNPGKAAIKAALEPADTDYYYFFTDSNGKYYYNETYEEHVSQWKALSENQS